MALCQGPRGRPGPSTRSPSHPPSLILHPTNPHPQQVHESCPPFTPTSSESPPALALLTHSRSIWLVLPCGNSWAPSPLGQVQTPPEALRGPHLLTPPLPLRRGSPIPSLQGNFLFCSCVCSCPSPPGAMGLQFSLSPLPCSPSTSWKSWGGAVLTSLGAHSQGPSHLQSARWMLEPREGVGGPNVGGRQRPGTEGGWQV